MTKKDNSIKIAKKRTENTLKQLKLIGNLANAYYSLTDEQLKDIGKAIEIGAKEAREKLLNGKAQTKEKALFNPDW
tara:strand:- start:269 stop:496 length:228 start_codon:yes stop_codon:yes gene_type:complete